MIESTPGSPYTGSLPDLLSVEENMRYRWAPLPFPAIPLVPCSLTDLTVGSWPANT